MKGRKNKATGGANEAAEDDAPEARDNAKKIESEAKERKDGGRAKRKAGGPVAPVARKEGGPVSGAPAVATAARAARKSGGGVGAPFSAAHTGTPAPGRKVQPQG